MAGAAASFIGGSCAFWTGRRIGHSGLERIRWLHLTPERMAWPDRFLKLHGAKTVFIARFIALFPPIVANLLAGMSKLSWPTFLACNLARSAAYAATYFLVGHFFGRRWKSTEAWLRPATLYAILAAVVLIACGVIFRHSWIGWIERTRHKRQRGA